MGDDNDEYPYGNDNYNDYEEDDDDSTDEHSSQKFQPGDHIFRWQLLKFMLYPIQIHGIVLKVEDITEHDDKEEEDSKDNPTNNNDDDDGDEDDTMADVPLGGVAPPQSSSLSSS